MQYDFGLERGRPVLVPRAVSDVPVLDDVALTWLMRRVVAAERCVADWTDIRGREYREAVGRAKALRALADELAG